MTCFEITLDKYPTGVYLVEKDKIPQWGILHGCNN